MDESTGGHDYQLYLAEELLLPLEISSTSHIGTLVSDSLSASLPSTLPPQLQHIVTESTDPSSGHVICHRRNRVLRPSLGKSQP